MKRLLAVGFGLAALALPMPALAEPMPSLLTIAPAGPVVNLSVTNSIEVAPDIAYITFGVVSRNKDRQVALQENRAAMDKVKASLKAAGVADADIQTAYFSVSEDIDYSAEAKPKKLGFLVMNSITVKVRKLEGLGELVANASAAGANDIGAPSFDVADKTAYVEKLTSAATSDARKRGEYHAKLNGYSGVKLVSVSDEVRSGPGGSAMAYAAYAKVEDTAAAAVDGSGPTFDPSPVTISVSLYFAFEMTK